MKTRKFLQPIVALSLCILLLIGCSRVPAGTVHGKLIDESGQPVSEINLGLLSVTSQDGDELSLESTGQETSSDENGNFSFTSVNSGKYVLVVLSFSFSLGQAPSFNLAQQVIRDENGKVLIFELSQSKGIDLGNLVWDK